MTGITNRELGEKLERDLLDHMDGWSQCEMMVNLDDIRAAVAFLKAMPNGTIYPKETPPVVEHAGRGEIVHRMGEQYVGEDA